MFGAIIKILSVKYDTPKSMLYAISGGTIASFTVGGIGLYLDWYHWIVPGVVNLRGSYVMLDQGLTGLTTATFPAWITVLFLSLYPFWFACGFEFAKRRQWETGVVPLLMIGILLMAVPSVIESQLLPH
jgi:hypothetical protein